MGKRKEEIEENGIGSQELPTDFVPIGSDEELFINLKEPGEVFTGQFLRRIDKGSEGLKYPGALFAEYPSGTMRVLPYNWSIAEKIAEMERQDPEYWSNHILRIELIRVKRNEDGTSVKLFRYLAMRKPSGFKPAWNEQFQP